MRNTDVPNQTAHMLIQCAWGRVFAQLRVVAFQHVLMEELNSYAWKS